MNTQKNLRHIATRFGAGIALATLLASQFVGTAIAASSWNPTLLVNTESFQTIDEGDSTTDVEVRFGSTLNEKIYWDRTGGRFRFSDDVFVEGTLSASGTLLLESGAYIDGSTLVIDANSNRIGVGTVAPKTSVEVVGTISGSTLKISNNISGSGSLFLESHLTGATIAGFGLYDCEGTGNKVTWDSATNKFKCEADQTGGSGTFGTGNVITIGDSRYVNQSGDTMTGALTVNLTSGSLGVDVKQTLSGSRLRVSAGGADIQGTLNASGAVRTDGDLTLNDDQTANTDAVLTFGSDDLNETLTFADVADRFEFSDDLRVLGNISGSTLRVDGNADIHGTLSVTGAIIGDANLTLNADQTANTDTVLTFGSDDLNETLTFADIADQWEFSDDVEVQGTLSGTTVHANTLLRSSGSLAIETGNIAINNLAYSFPSAFGSSGAVLKNNGNGTLSWAAGTNAGSGDILALEPEYDNVTYVASGAINATGNVGTLAYTYDSTNKRNHYRWQTTKTANQAYWISTRVRVPNNFSVWDPTVPLRFNYRASGSYLEVKMSDTAGTAVPLTGATYLRNNSTSWATATITGPNTTGTFTPGGFINVFVKLVGSGTTLTTDEFADAGTLQFNWETTNP